MGSAGCFRGQDRPTGSRGAGISDTKFLGEAVGGRITFVRDQPSGRVMSFIVRQGGREMTAKRVE